MKVTTHAVSRIRLSPTISQNYEKNCHFADIRVGMSRLGAVDNNYDFASAIIEVEVEIKATIQVKATIQGGISSHNNKGHVG